MSAQPLITTGNYRISFERRGIPQHCTGRMGRVHDQECAHLLSTSGHATNVHEGACSVLHTANGYDTRGFVYGVNDRVCQITIRKVIDKTNTDFFKIELVNPRASDCGKVGGNCKNCGIGFETK